MEMDAAILVTLLPHTTMAHIACDVILMLKKIYNFSSLLPLGICSAAIVASGSAIAQDGPELPCLDCPVPETAERLVKPEAGIWRNPEQSGTGFMFEVQNDRIAGYYYLYNEEGTPIWYLFVATLESSDEEGVKWVAEAPLQLAENGQCLGCEYQPPDHEVTDIILRVEFLYRTYARFRVNDSNYQYILPLTYGISGSPVFRPYTEYVFPELFGQWIFAFQSAGFRSYGTSIIQLFNVMPDQPDVVKSYLITVPNGFPGVVDAVIPIGHMDCYVSEDAGPLCEMAFDEDTAFESIEGKIFYVRPGDISDSRLFGETESGWNIEGFRLEHD